MANSDKKRMLTKKDIHKIVWRSLPLEASWHYERQQHLGFYYAV